MRPATLPLAALLLALSGCDREEKPPVEIRNDMNRQLHVKPQKSSTAFPDGLSDRAPVPGTVSRGARPYRFAGVKVDEFLKGEGSGWKNPIALTIPVLARGEDRYNVFCVPCHGPLGKGDGLVPEKGFPQPPTLHSAKLRAYPDSAIFHVLSAGQNAMPSYARQLTVEDRWAVVHYVRALQRSQAARPEDVAGLAAASPVPASSPAGGGKR